MKSFVQAYSQGNDFPNYNNFLSKNLYGKLLVQTYFRGNGFATTKNFGEKIFINISC